MKQLSYQRFAFILSVIVSQKLLDEIQLANQMQNAESSAWDSDSLSINPSLVGNTDTDGKCSLEWLCRVSSTFILLHVEFYF